MTHAENVNSNPSKSVPLFTLNVYDVVDSIWFWIIYALISCLLLQRERQLVVVFKSKSMGNPSFFFKLKMWPFNLISGEPQVNRAGQHRRKGSRGPSSPWRSRWLLWTDFGALEKVVGVKDSTCVKNSWVNSTQPTISKLAHIITSSVTWAQSNQLDDLPNQITLTLKSIELHFPEGSA